MKHTLGISLGLAFMLSVHVAGAEASGSVEAGPDAEIDAGLEASTVDAGDATLLLDADQTDAGDATIMADVEVADVTTDVALDAMTEAAADAPSDVTTSDAVADASGVRDASSASDAQVTDAPVATSDARSPGDAGTAAAEGGGCECQLAPNRTRLSPGAFALALFGALALRRRKNQARR